jgi:hypothetical protein
MARASRPTLKNLVIESLFFDRWDEKRRTLSNPVVTAEHLKQKLRELRIARGVDVGPDGLTKERVEELGLDESYVGLPGLSENNPANGLTDIVRKSTRNDLFPREVFKKGYTAKQLVGDRTVFEFVRVASGQTEPFPERPINPELFDAIYDVQTVSLNISSRRLGRRDESWLTRVIGDLKLVETHLALRSPLGFRFLEPLQTNMKLRRAEIDALYFGRVGRSDSSLTDVLVSCEMKHRTEVLEEEQLLRGARAARAEAAKRLRIPNLLVVPIGIKVVRHDDPKKNGLIHVVEYGTDLDVGKLEPVSEALYRLVPRVPGVN